MPTFGSGALLQNVGDPMVILSSNSASRDEMSNKHLITASDENSSFLREDDGGDGGEDELDSALATSLGRGPRPIKDQVGSSTPELFMG